MPRDDMKQIGDLLDNSTASLVVLGKSQLEQTPRKALTHATKQYEREIAADSKAFNKDYDAAVDDLIKKG